MCSYYVNDNRIIAFFSIDEVYVYVFSVLVRTAYEISLPAVHIPHYKALFIIGVLDLHWFDWYNRTTRVVVFSKACTCSVLVNARTMCAVTSHAMQPKINLLRSNGIYNQFTNKERRCLD
jgi:hypothetical protein